MELRHVKNITNDGTAEMYLFDTIGRSFNDQTGRFEGIDGQSFADEINWINSDPSVSAINVRINSAGGSVIDGFSIFSAIKNSKKPVSTFIEGLGASISGIIFQAGQKRYISDFGRLMVHDPSFGTPIEFMSEKQRKALESFRDQLVTILTNNSKLTETEISDLMARETWFTAEQTIENGLADEIISTGRVLNEATTPDQLLALVNSMYNQNKVQKMEQIRNHFGLDAKADETSILNKIKENETLLANAQNKVSELEAEKVALEEEKTELEKEVKEQNDARAVESVENAIKGGLIEESSKEQMIEIAKNNLDTFKTILKSVKRTPVRVTNTVQTNNGGKNVSLREMEKNNPKEVQRILNEEPETYKQMYLDQYGVEPSI
jgi:ATP-dependent protease ClpP protease subunit